MDQQEAFERLSKARHAYLATADPDGRPHIVPIVFGVVDGQIVTAVDHKPKRSLALKRLANIAANPLVAVLADHYTEQWEQLWWVRVDGIARVLRAGEAERWLEPLIDKYEHYRDRPPAGPVIVVEIVRVSGWASAPNQ